MFQTKSEHHICAYNCNRRTGFRDRKKIWGSGYLAAPYCVLRLTQAKKCNTECVYRLEHFHTIGLMGQSYGKEIIHLNFTLVNVMAVINVMLL